jgi:hypothetical protein
MSRKNILVSTKAHHRRLSEQVSQEMHRQNIALDDAFGNNIDYLTWYT